MKEIFILLNFGLVILIWMVQLIIYPGFLYYSDKDLIKWHQVYTSAITLIVMPLMLGQLALSGYYVFYKFNMLNLLIMMIVLVLWIITFTKAVPAHGNIAKGINVNEQANYLVNMNWYRSILWTSVFILSIFI